MVEGEYPLFKKINKLDVWIGGHTGTRNGSTRAYAIVVNFIKDIESSSIAVDKPKLI